MLFGVAPYGHFFLLFSFYLLSLSPLLGFLQGGSKDVISCVIQHEAGTSSTIGGGGDVAYLSPFSEGTARK